jgi:hypothetical protein
MYILVLDVFDKEARTISFKIVYASKFKKKVENYYFSLVKKNPEKYGPADLRVLQINSGEMDLCIGSCEYD